MKRFVRLFTALDQTTSTKKKVAALAAYFDAASDDDKLWTIAILSGRRPKRAVTTKQLRAWAAGVGGVPDWLFAESYSVVGDLAETIALVLPPAGETADRPLAGWVEHIRALNGEGEMEQQRSIEEAWGALDHNGRFVFNKLITGGFRMGVSQKLMTRALARHTGLEEDVLAYRLMGDWTPDTTTFHDLLFGEDPAADASRPYPFYLAYPLEGEPESLGVPGDWIVERKWDGIRAQVVVRGGCVHVWSRGEELITERFPEFVQLAEVLPEGTVLDGELLGWGGDAPLPFSDLQRRIGRKKVSKTLLREVPAVLVAYDLLEDAGEDIRTLATSERRFRLEALVNSAPPNTVLKLSPALDGGGWEALRAERERSREERCEGLMLKRRNAPYRAGRKKGDWWKWKVDPLTIDAVVIYAMRGHGRRANLYTDYTFAVWKKGELVPFAKAYSGLTDAEIRRVDRWVKANTTERFGPVRGVKPELVMELAFEGISRSPRHKSGIALRFPRIARWREDKPASEADTFETLEAMLERYG